VLEKQNKNYEKDPRHPRRCRRHIGVQLCRKYEISPKNYAGNILF